MGIEREIEKIIQPGDPTDPVLSRHASQAEDLPVSYGSAVPLAYCPAGNPGNTGTLFLYGLFGMVAGLAAGAGCAAGAALLNVVHNLLPVFIFVLPLLIIAFLALAPAVVGLTVGSVMAGGIKAARCRQPAMAGLVAGTCTLGALGLFLLIARLFTPPDESFFTDQLLPFVRLMIGGCVNFTWLEQPEPLNVPAWMIYGILGLSAGLGVLAAYGAADEKVRSMPFCEHCGHYLGTDTLWSIPSIQGVPTIEAFDLMDVEALLQIPRCNHFRNRIDVDLWSCSCRSEHFLELVAHAIEPGKNGDEDKPSDPVRIYSRPLSAEEVDRMRVCERSWRAGAA